MRTWLLLSLGLLLACEKRASSSTAATTDASASAGELDGGGARGAALENEPLPTLPGGAPNLLEIVPSKIAVSSRVDNPRDFPEHLMDGDLDTAWNGKTGDLKASILFRVPADARVERVDLTVGFDKTTEKYDLFKANHRIKRVAVHRNGAKLKEVTLDPDKRGWQAIPVGTEGGDFRLEVLETLPGTKKEWREIVISEMRVVGKPGKERRPAGTPLRIGVGSLDATLDALPTDVSKTSLAAEKALESVCASYIASVTPEWERMQKEADDGPLGEFRKQWKPPFCAPTTWTGTFKGDGTWKDARAVRLGYAMTDEARLVVELARGWVLTPIEWDDKGGNLLGCPSVFEPSSVPEVKVEHGFLFATVDGTRMTMAGAPSMRLSRPHEDVGTPNEAAQDDGMRLVLARGATWCKDTGTEITCEVYNPQYQEALAQKAQPKRDGMVPWSTLQWKEVRGFHLGPDGKLNVDPKN